MIDGADNLTVVEARAGQTVTRDLMSPARRVAQARVSGNPWIVFGGDSTERRSNCTLLPWHQASQITAS
ncbi:MAG: hypothetical protein RQ826_17255 [Xanthomonadales bacterium]|nr:hypothetical protein [Xanthomonadales bacterium]